MFTNDVYRLVGVDAEGYHHPGDILAGIDEDEVRLNADQLVRVHPDYVEVRVQLLEAGSDSIEDGWYIASL